MAWWFSKNVQPVAVFRQPGSPVDLGSVIGAVAVDLSSAAFTAPADARGLYVGAAGDVKVDMFDGSTVTYVGLAAGVEHAITVKKIYKSGTTATGILVLK